MKRVRDIRPVLETIDGALDRAGGTGTSSARNSWRSLQDRESIVVLDLRAKCSSPPARTPGSAPVVGCRDGARASSARVAQRAGRSRVGRSRDMVGECWSVVTGSSRRHHVRSTTSRRDEVACSCSLASPASARRASPTRSSARPRVAASPSRRAGAGRAAVRRRCSPGSRSSTRWGSRCRRSPRPAAATMHALACGSSRLSPRRWSGRRAHGRSRSCSTTSTSRTSARCCCCSSSRASCAGCACSSSRPAGMPTRP